MSLEKPLYKLKSTAKGHCIERPDGSVVNNWYWKEKVQANKYLELLEAYNVCRRE